MTIDSVAWLDGNIEPAHIAAAIGKLYPTRILDMVPSPAVPELTEIVFRDASSKQIRRMSVIVNATCEPVDGTDPCTWVRLSATDDGPEIVKRLAMHFGGHYAREDIGDELTLFSLSGHEQLAREAEKRQPAAPISGTS